MSPSIPSAILTALPWVYLTTELHIVPSSAVEQGQLPPGVQVTKLFLRSDVEVLEQEFSKVRDMGSGTVDEWLKGLDGRGKDTRQQVSKWEKWDSSGGVAKMQSLLYPGYRETTHQPPAQTGQATPAANLAIATSSSTLPPIPPPPFSHARQERTQEEVAQLKAARKTEIERRALLLDPPLPPNVLRHIPSFQAATHIITPLDDNAWELLKPRLLAQRAEAEACEEEAAPRTKPAEEPVSRPALEETLATTKEARELIDRDWEIVQAPLRGKIASYADEIIRDHWERGKKVTKESCSKFAIDVLVHIRKRFYAEIAKESAAAKAAGKGPVVDPPQGPFTQKLTLENMKWIFDTKIKPLTEPYRKELFYCSACEGNPKAFGFEGVIQHYAAKHTTALSLGSIVVHWRAEWPEQAPYSPEVRPVKPHYHSHVPASFGGSAVGPAVGPPVGYGYTIPLTPAPLAVPTYPPAPPPAPAYGAPPYPDPYQQPPPPQPYPPHNGYPSFPPPPNYGQQPPYTTPGPGPFPPYPPSAAQYPPGGAEPAHPYHPPPLNPVYGPYPSNAPTPYPPAAPQSFPDGYQARLEEVARNSRDVWQALGNLKDLPGSARVSITIHHVIKRFRARYYEAPPLLLFIDGLSNNKDMRPVRNINGLMCKACQLGLGNAPSVQEDRKSFSLPQLTNHFQSKHIEPMHVQGSPPLDWAVDMVFLVEQDKVPKLRPSMSEYQRSLVADAFPGIFDPQALLAAGSYRHFPDAHQREKPNTPTGVTVQGQDVPGVGHYSADCNTLETAPGFQPLANPLGPSQPPQFTPQHLGNRGPDGYPEFGYAHSRALTDMHTSGSSNGRNTPQGLQQANDHSTYQGRRRGNSKNRRRHQSSADNRMSFEDEEEIRGVWAIDRTENTRTRSSGGANSGGRGGPYAPPPAQSSNGVAPRYGPPSPIPMPARDEPSLLGALEKHLDEGHGATKRPGSPPPADSYYSERRSTAPAPRYQGEPSFDARPAHAERRDLGYESYHAPPAVGEEAQARRWDDTRFEQPRPRSGDRAYEVEARPSPYYHAEHAQPRPRQAVEAYEIVQVIDERGQYYIRRPARREPEMRYVPDQSHSQSGHAGKYAGQEPYFDGPRESFPHDSRHNARAADSRVAPRNPGYYEEYDPRFPTA